MQELSLQISAHNPQWDKILKTLQNAFNATITADSLCTENE